MSSLDSLLPPESPSPRPANGDALLASARTVAEEVLAPRAEQTDQSEIVPRENLSAIAQAGLLGISGPVEYGGQAAPGAVSRQVAEILAGACGVTHFVQAQHHGPVGLIASSENAAVRDKYLRALCEGRMMAGVAFSHLRKVGDPALSAEPVSNGYRISGMAPWVTSWGLAGVFVVAAQLSDDRILYLCLQGEPGDAVHPSEPLDLAVMNASSTVRLSFDGLFVPEESVVRIMHAGDWRKRDRINTAHPNPAIFGIARACMEGIKAAASGDEAERAVVRLSEEWESCRSEAYDIADSSPAEDDIPQLLALKAWSLDIGIRCAHAYIAAVGGRAMAVSHPAQRLMREAMFYTIQAQTSAVRAATLERIGSRSGDDGTPAPPGSRRL